MQKGHSAAIARSTRKGAGMSRAEEINGQDPKGQLSKFDCDELSNLAHDLFPLNRSVVGRDYDSSLSLFERYVSLDVFSVKSGTRVFDWTIPQGWSVGPSAGVYHLDGTIALDLSLNNLQIVSHSSAVDQVMKGHEIKALMHTLPTNPAWVPYVTSYYRETVGFCGTEIERELLDDDADYRLFIPAEKYDHYLRLAEFVVPGATEEEILITSYLCHPSMGNNELSGPLVWLRLIHLLQSRPEKNRYTYRFLLAPETIGSIAWVATRYPEVSSKVVSAIVLTCLGGPQEKLSIKLSNHDLVSGQKHVLDDFALLGEREGRWVTREFSPLNGSDERQFSSPGVRIPTIQVARTVYGTYEEYHTSADTLDFMDVNKVCDSATQVFELLKDFELSSQPLHSNIDGGEPQLGKRDLYPTTSTPKLHYGGGRQGLSFENVPLDDILTTYHLIDGRSAIEVAKASGIEIGAVLNAVRLLRSKGVLS